ncbi:hypothetical protein [Laribacter hongkongensis]|uniref:hypothetical protein n=1 Tax=Laribacter hongkongensis TaxID=168471 RepID=UPI001EFDE30C|nr:hypothetical protein [Laribacter hongkongensis]MCG9079931.1 hypothetical protein [Laribacter hongkongensis]
MQATIKYYEIKKFGFYKYKGTSPEFGDIASTINQIKSMMKDSNVDFVNTKTHESSEDKSILNTYFVDLEIDNKTGDTVLILWNEYKNSEGKIYGLPKHKKPGSNKLTPKEFKDSIPGVPSYFYISPRNKIIASIIFPHSISGKQQLEYYLIGYLRNKSPYKMVDESSSDEIKIIGYSIDGKNNEKTLPSRRPSIHFSPIFDDQPKKQIMSKIDSISAFIRRETISFEHSDERSIIEKMLTQFIKLEDPSITSQDFYQKRKITQELEFHPTTQELETIIDNYYKQSESNIESGADIGFKFKDGTRTMLSGKAMSESVTFNLKANDDTIIDATIILAQSKYYIDKIAKLIKAQHEEEVPCESILQAY